MNKISINVVIISIIILTHTAFHMFSVKSPDQQFADHVIKQLLVARDFPSSKQRTLAGKNGKYFHLCA